MKNFLKLFSNIIDRYWKIKVFAFWILCLFPNRILYYLQHNITKRSIKPILEIDNDWQFIYEKINENSNDTKNINLIEFGAGRNLAQNIFLSLKIKNLHQTVVDLNPMINTRMALKAYSEISKILNLPLDVNINSIEKLLKKLNIIYLAPLDISKYCPKRKFDFCISKDTLEHIPIKKLNYIIKNLKNILVKNGLLISCVDYSDHYAHRDKSISDINFLKYSDFLWFFLNPPNHYQNRIRHIDLKRIFEINKFITLEEQLISQKQIDIKLSNDFMNYKNNDLLILRSKILSKSF